MGVYGKAPSLKINAVIVQYPDSTSRLAWYANKGNVSETCQMSQIEVTPFVPIWNY